MRTSPATSVEPTPHTAPRRAGTVGRRGWASPLPHLDLPHRARPDDDRQAGQQVHEELLEQRGLHGRDLPLAVVREAGRDVRSEPRLRTLGPRSMPESVRRRRAIASVGDGRGAGAYFVEASYRSSSARVCRTSRTAASGPDLLVVLRVQHGLAHRHRQG